MAEEATGKRPLEEQAGEADSKEPETKVAKIRHHEAGEVDSKEPETKVAKRPPRYYDKAFGELSINEFESILRELLALKKQSEKKDEDLSKLNDIKAEKKELLKKIKELEKSLEKKSSQAEQQPGKQPREEPDDETAERIKKALEKTLLSQLEFRAAFKEELKSSGREITAVHGNVRPEVLKLLNLEHGEQVKYADRFFGQQLARTVQSVRLVVARDMHVKWVKTTQELKVDARYKLEVPKRAAPKKKVSGRGKAKDEVEPDDGFASCADEAEAEGEGQEDAGQDGETAQASEVTYEPADDID